MTKCLGYPKRLDNLFLTGLGVFHCESCFRIYNISIGEIMKKPFLKLSALIILISILLSSCGLFLGPPRLLVVNDFPDHEIIKVELVGYDFENLYIPTGSLQEFILENGMPAGYSNIYVTVWAELSPVNMPADSSDYFDFADGQITVITLKGYNDLR
jgi:hypothetical protein